MVAGGKAYPSGDIKDTTFIYDVTADSWSPGPAMSGIRYYHTCKLITDANGDKKVFAVGGLKPSNSPPFHVDMDVYDVASQTWSICTITNRNIYQLNVLILFPI